MTSILPKTDEYLEALESALEALGPDETQEVIAEIRGLLADAAADGDEGDLLAGFGGPDAFAARILEERGIVSEESRVPGAPPGAIAIAGTIDVISSLAAALLFYAVVALSVSASAYWGYSGTLVSVVLWTAATAFLGGLVWWWAGKRRRPEYVSTGMEVVGIRKIQVGETTRTVRGRDIPGLGKRTPVMPMVKTGIALLILMTSMLTIAYIRESRWENRTEKAVFDSSACAFVVTNVYRQVVDGAGASSLTGEYGPAAQEDLAALLRRYADGQFTSYAVDFVRLPEGATAETDAFDSASDIIVLVGMREFNDEQGTTAVYQYRVECILDHNDDGSAGGSFLIASVVPLDE